MFRERQSFLRLLRTVALVDLGIAIGAAVICWFIGWGTAWQYCDAVVLGGMMMISLGLLIFWQEWNLNREFTTMHAQSISDDDGHERVRLLQRDDDEGYRVFMHLFVAGLVAIVVGAVVQMAFAAR